MLWLYHILFESSGAFYAFVSGWGADLGLLCGAVMFWHKRTCHVHHCWRWCRYDVVGSPYRCCRRHHPEVPTKERVTPQHIIDACTIEHDRKDHHHAV